MVLTYCIYVWIVNIYLLRNLIKISIACLWYHIPWPINRGNFSIQNHTKTFYNICFLTSFLSCKFHIFKGVRIQFFNPCKFWPNLWFKHFLNIIWKLFEPSINLKNIQNSESHKTSFLWFLSHHILKIKYSGANTFPSLQTSFKHQIEVVWTLG